MIFLCKYIFFYHILPQEDMGVNEHGKQTNKNRGLIVVLHMKVTVGK